MSPSIRSVLEKAKFFSLGTNIFNKKHLTGLVRFNHSAEYIYTANGSEELKIEELYMLSYLMSFIKFMVELY
jgi:hypothetical protein